MIYSKQAICENCRNICSLYLWLCSLWPQGRTELTGRQRNLPGTRFTSGNLNQKIHLDLQQAGTYLFQLRASHWLWLRSNTPSDLALLVSSSDSSFWSAYNVCESRDEHAEGELSFWWCFINLFEVFFFLWSFFFFSFWLHSCLVCKSFQSRWLIAIFCSPQCPWTFLLNVDKS